MEDQIGIWIDSANAIIVTVNNGSSKVKVINSAIENRVHHQKEGDKGTFNGFQHINHERKFEERINHQTHDYLNEIISQIQNAEGLYIFGPAEMKKHLIKEIESNKRLQKNITVESADKMTKNQIVAKVKNFYKAL